MHTDPAAVGAPGGFAAAQDVDQGGAGAEPHRPGHTPGSYSGKEKMVFTHRSVS